MTAPYPRSFSEIAAWAAVNGVVAGESRIRFAQYGVLSGIAQTPLLQRGLAFKGGNALDFIWQPNRSTSDLDFSLDAGEPRFETLAETIRNPLAAGLARAGLLLGIVFAVNRIQRQPPGENRRLASLEVRVGYALLDEDRLRLRMANGQPSPHVIRIEISGNEPICDSTIVAIDAEHDLRVCTLEDIVAEKLRALLQQPIRNRERRQDLLDIAVALRAGHELDRKRIGSFLLIKAEARNIAVSRTAFRDPDIARRAQIGYAELAPTVRTQFIPFHDAWSELMAFVESLPIPERSPD